MTVVSPMGPPRVHEAMRALAGLARRSSRGRTGLAKPRDMSGAFEALLLVLFASTIAAAAFAVGTRFAHELRPGRWL